MGTEIYKYCADPDCNDDGIPFGIEDIKEWVGEADDSEVQVLLNFLAPGMGIETLADEQKWQLLSDAFKKYNLFELQKLLS